MFKIPQHISEALKKNKKRYINATDLPQVAPKTCKWCLKPCTGRRSVWCSDECVNKMLAIINTADQYLLARSKGKCELCGYMVKAAQDMRRHFQSLVYGMNLGEEDCFEIYEEIVHMGLPDVIELVLRTDWQAAATEKPVVKEWTWTAFSSHSYEVDHILPLIEGGWSCPTNMRVLCRRCHKKETKALAGRRAKSKKGQLSLQLPSA